MLDRLKGLEGLDGLEALKGLDGLEGLKRLDGLDWWQKHRNILVRSSLHANN